MSETVRADSRPQPSSCHLAHNGASSLLCRHPLEASRLAGEHAWLIDRVADRLAVCWPDQVDRARLRHEAWRVLERAAACVERVEDLAPAAAEAIDRRMRESVAAGEWYRLTLARRVRPLCAAWRGMLMAGRRPTDRTLCSRLHIGTNEIAGLFVDAALVFLVDPSALLPSQTDALDAVSEAIVELPTGQQLAVALYFEQYLTIPEIARIMSSEPGATQELLGRAVMFVSAHGGLARRAGGRAGSAWWHGQTDGL